MAIAAAARMSGSTLAKVALRTVAKFSAKRRQRGQGTGPFAGPREDQNGGSTFMTSVVLLVST